MATITIREHVITKKNSFGLEVTKSLNQDFVFVNDKLAGYLTHADKAFKPVFGWDNSHNKMVCEALQELKGADFGKIVAVDAITQADIDASQQPVEDDDE